LFKKRKGQIYPQISLTVIDYSIVFFSTPKLKKRRETKKEDEEEGKKAKASNN
jgi:hypothetical protein